jgi:hypothetical protein
MLEGFVNRLVDVLNHCREGDRGVFWSCLRTSSFEARIMCVNAPKLSTPPQDALRARPPSIGVSGPSSCGFSRHFAVGPRGSCRRRTATDEEVHYCVLWDTGGGWWAVVALHIAFPGLRKPLPTTAACAAFLCRRLCGMPSVVSDEASVPLVRLVPPVLGDANFIAACAALRRSRMPRTLSPLVRHCAD